MSPLTAPFSSCHLWDLLADRELQEGPPVQVKAPKDDATAAPDSTPMVLFVEAANAFRPCYLSRFTRRTLEMPLRL